MDDTRAHSQDIRPLRIAILNLMPLKITTETDLIRLLSNTPLQLEISFMKLKSHTPKNTPIEHMMMFYRDFESMRNEKYDGISAFSNLSFLSCFLFLRVTRSEHPCCSSLVGPAR